MSLSLWIIGGVLALLLWGINAELNRIRLAVERQGEHTRSLERIAVMLEQISYNLDDDDDELGDFR